MSGCSGDDATDSTTTAGSVGSPTIVGAWERVGGDFSELSGMVATVASADADGIISSTPTNQYGFVVGDVKWASITEVSPREYTFADLLSDTANDTTSYIPGTIVIADDGATLEMSFQSGTIQEWARSG